MDTEDSLAKLGKEMRACRLCLEAGYDITPGAVFRGGPGAEVMLIGQAPGITEVETKRPFNAGSGTRLFQWLGQAGWEEDEFRTRQYMTAVTKCYPGKGINGKGDRVPSKTEQALCRRFLEREIALVNPKLLILVGGLAIKLLYPAKMKLNEVVGTAVYYPPESLTNPVNFNYDDGQILTPTNLRSLISSLLASHQQPAASDQHGRFIVPLPHPSGASLWPNKPANKRLISRAIQILDILQVAFNHHET